MAKGVPDNRQRLARIRQLPAHQHHERETEEEKNQPADPVLDADDLVIGRENVFPPEAELVVLVPGRGDVDRVGVEWEASSVEASIDGETEAEYQGKVFKWKARICRIWASRQPCCE